MKKIKRAVKAGTDLKASSLLDSFCNAGSKKRYVGYLGGRSSMCLPSVELWMSQYRPAGQGVLTGTIVAWMYGGGSPATF